MAKTKQSSVSPFLTGLNKLILEIRQSGTQSDGDEAIDGHILKTRTLKDILVDPKEYVKMYHDLDGISRVLSLSRSAKDLYILIPHLMKKNEDFIVCTNSYLQKKLNLSKNSVSQAITELRQIALLANKGQSEYWVNPYMIFKGDRIRHFRKNAPQSIEVKQTKQLMLDFDKITTKKFIASV